MTVYPSELEQRQEASDLLDDALRASQTFLTVAQRARAEAAVEAHLAMLRRRWELRGVERYRRREEP